MTLLIMHYLSSRPADLDNLHLGWQSNLASVHALGCEMILGRVVGHLWDRSVNKSTRTVYEADFRALRRFSDMSSMEA